MAISNSAIIDGIVIAVDFLARLVYLHVGGNGDAVFVDLVDFHRDSPLWKKVKRVACTLVLISCRKLSLGESRLARRPFAFQRQSIIAPFGLFADSVFKQRSRFSRSRFCL